MYNLKLQPGDKVAVYLDHKNDLNYQGFAILQEKIKEGDTFFEDYERMYVPDDSKTQLGRITDKRQLELNEKYESLQRYFNSNNAAINSFKNHLKKICSRRNTSYNKMHLFCQAQRELFSTDPTHAINSLFNDHSNKHIVRYIQQDKIREWNPTLFKGERWLVEFPIQSDLKFNVLYNTPFRTNRWIKVLVKISPKEDKIRNELSRLTSYDSISNYDRYLDRQEDDED